MKCTISSDFAANFRKLVTLKRQVSFKILKKKTFSTLCLMVILLRLYVFSGQFDALAYVHIYCY